MEKLVNKLKRGLAYDDVPLHQLILVEILKNKGVLYETKKKGQDVFRFCNNVNISADGDKFIFEVFPNKYMGIFFDYEDLFECESSSKYAPDTYCVTYALNPSQEKIENYGLGNTVKVKVLARGYNNSNEGLLIRLPNRELEFYDLDNDPCMTIGLAYGAKAKNTALIDFDKELNGTFIEGRKGLCIDDMIYFDVKAIENKSNYYEMGINENGKYYVKDLKNPSREDRLKKYMKEKELGLRH